MKLIAYAEFRGFEERISKNGSKYFINFFEESNGHPFNMVSRDTINLEKGTQCKLDVEYVSNSTTSFMKLVKCSKYDRK